MLNIKSHIKEPSSSPSYSPKNKRWNKGKKIAHDSTMIGVVKVIAGRFVEGGLSNNAWKRHLWIVMVVENKKVKVENT